MTYLDFEPETLLMSKIISWQLQEIPAEQIVENIMYETNSNYSDIVNILPSLATKGNNVKIKFIELLDVIKEKSPELTALVEITKLKMMFYNGGGKLSSTIIEQMNFCLENNYVDEFVYSIKLRVLLQNNLKKEDYLEIDKYVKLIEELNTSIYE